MVKKLDNVTQQLLKENNELKAHHSNGESVKPSTSYISYLYNKLTNLW